MATLQDVLDFYWSEKSSQFKRAEFQEYIVLNFGKEAANEFNAFVEKLCADSSRRYLYQLHDHSEYARPYFVALKEATGNIEADLPAIKLAIMRRSKGENGIHKCFSSIEYLGHMEV